MQTTKRALLHRTWTRDAFLISTDPSLIPVQDLNAVFATDLVYWADPLPDDVMRETLQNSLCFGLYETQPFTKAISNQLGGSTGIQGLAVQSKRTLIGFARCVTDFSTFSYLTDVYILPSHQGEGLGRWLVRCVGEVHDSMPHLRRSLLFTSDWERSVPFYEKVLGMELCKGNGGKESEGPAIMQKRGRGFPVSLQ